MSNYYPAEANQNPTASHVRREEQISLVKPSNDLFKKFLIIIFIAAVAFWALVLPFFSKSIITAVKSWLHIAG